MNNILISACAVAASKRRPARASDSDDGAEEDRSDTDSLRRVIDRMFEPHADVDYCDKAKEIYQWCIKTYYTHPDAKFTRDEIKKGCPLITPEIIEHASKILVQTRHFFHCDATKRTAYYVLNTDKIPKVPLRTPVTSPHKERDGSVIGRKLLRFPTRDQAMKQLLIFNQYFQADVVKSLDNQQKYDILADDGKHYHALYHEVDGVPCLELPNWGPEGVIKGDLSQLCVARLGKYSAADGLNVDTNRYTAVKRHAKVASEERPFKQQRVGPVAAPRATYLDAAALLKFEKRITENRQEIVNFKNEFVNQLESIIKNGMEALQQQQKLLDEVKLYLTKEGMAVASTDMIAIDDSVTEKLIKRAKHSISVFRDDLTDELLQAESLGINLERSVVKYRRQRQRELGDML